MVTARERRLRSAVQNWRPYIFLHPRAGHPYPGRRRKHRFEIPIAADAGYVLFDLESERKTFRGALEIVKITDAQGRPALRLFIRIEDRPSYMERGMLNRLERKLRDEHGQPPPPPKRKPKDDDAGKDNDEPPKGE